MNYAIVTGVSKGLGESTAKYLMESDVSVIGISRSKNRQLNLIAEENNVAYTHFEADLSKVESVSKLIDEIDQLLVDQDVTALYLVNNAAMVEPIQKSTSIEGEALTRHFQLNAMTPMTLMNHYLNRSEDNTFIGVNISSGAATNPYYGWSAYCSSKASLDMYTKTVALEQKQQSSTHKVFAFSPGVMDTTMQAEIRSANKEDFIEIERFKNYKENNILSNTDAVATILVDILLDVSEIDSGKIYNVKDYF